MLKLMHSKGDKKKQEKRTRNRLIILGIIIGTIISSLILVINGNIIASIIAFLASPVIIILYYSFLKQLKESARIRKIEDIFPDFLQLMASNLRAGMTIDKSMLLSVRKEFDPLDKEIQKTGRDIATGKEIEIALHDMAKRIGSEMIKKTIMLIISGIRAGGNLATLLEQTSVNMRERNFLEKRASSSVLMYVIFIFVAVSLAAPALFALSSVLVETLINLLSGLPQVDAAVNLPFTLTSVTISVNFIKYFSIIFIIVSDVLACLVLGLISKGEEKEGLKYLAPVLITGLAVFFFIRYLLLNLMGDFFNL